MPHITVINQLNEVLIEMQKKQGIWFKTKSNERTHVVYDENRNPIRLELQKKRNNKWTTKKILLDNPSKVELFIHVQKLLNN